MTALRVPGPVVSRARVLARVRGLGAPTILLLSLGVYVTLSLTASIAPYHPLAILAFFDLKVYRGAAGAVVHGLGLYSVRFPHNLSFTYPPFAALAMVPLRLLPVRVDEVVVTVVNGVLVLAIAWWALGLRRRGAADGTVPVAPGRRFSVACLAAAVGVWCEPVNSALGFGQIDVLIAALILADLCRGDRRGAGIGIGLAAGLKLTPLIFIPYLLLIGRVRAAVTATATFAGTIVVGAIVLPADSRSYWWRGGFADTSRVSGLAHSGGGPANQSLRGALLRVVPGIGDHASAWLALAVVVACAGLVLAVLAARRGDAARGFVLTAITGLLVSPISWTHQWTLATPGLLLWLLAPRRSRTTTMAVALVIGAFLAFSWDLWPVIGIQGPPARLSLSDQIVANVYVLAGLIALGAAAAQELMGERVGARRAAEPGVPNAALPEAGVSDVALPDAGPPGVRSAIHSERV